MKIGHLTMLAGTAALIAAVPVHAVPTITLTINTTDPFLVANQLRSVVISITGFDSGTAIRGIKGIDAQPWMVLYGSFFNVNTVMNSDPPIPLFTDGLYAAPSNNVTINAINPAARWDSGLLGSLTTQPNPNTLSVLTNCDSADHFGGFALFTDGGSDYSIAPASWMSAAPGGIPVGAASNFRVMRLTYPLVAQVSVRFVLVMTNGQEFTLFTHPALTGPITALGACCLPSGDCLAWRPQFYCDEQGGTWSANHPCGTCPIAACCIGDSCQPMSEPDCVTSGGTWLGEGSVCGPSSCRIGAPCTADLVPACGDDAVNVADLLAVIGAWGACGNPNDCPADIAPPGPPAGNDVVDVDDLLAVISAWGACPL